jgi:hypothetical protein
MGMVQLLSDLGRIGSNDNDTLKLADPCGYFGKNRLHLAETGEPVAVFVGPGYNNSILVFPFCG